ncbi:hypothetical protein [Bradyrhizobium sp. STM 3561]|uniref:hypothetical protein n=1 Tax=Bradyrhizobium sp. STM 3561 TaxID=578923 RepID=UPI00388E62B4
MAVEPAGSPPLRSASQLVQRQQAGVTLLTLAAALKNELPGGFRNCKAGAGPLSPKVGDLAGDIRCHYANGLIRRHLNYQIRRVAHHC